MLNYIALGVSKVTKYDVPDLMGDIRPILKAMR